MLLPLRKEEEAREESIAKVVSFILIALRLDQEKPIAFCAKFSLIDICRQ